MSAPDHRPDATDQLSALLRDRILVLDGAMGTMIQGHRLEEAQFRGERFADWSQDLRGNNDLLSLTQPDLIREIHREYLQAGADLVETNTFNAQAISLLDYGMQDLAYEMNLAAATLALLAACHPGNAEAKRLAVSCDTGDGVACNQLALRLQKGEYVLQDDGRAAKLFGRACDASTASCISRPR